MISLPKLVRLASCNEHGRVLEEVVRNGRPLPLRVRLRLEDARTLPAAALGLALQRVTELTYRPTEASLLLLESLLGHGEADGSFGSIAATAVALAALHASLDQIDALPRGSVNGYMPRGLESRCRAASAAALHALSQAQRRGADDESSEPEEGLLGDEVDSTIALWQLGLDARFARMVRFEALLAAVEDRGLRHDRGVGALLEGLDAASCRQGPPEGRNHIGGRSAAAA